MTRKQSEETTAVLPAPHLWLRDQNASLTATLAWLLPLMLIIGLATYMRTVDLNVLGYNSDEAVYAGQGAAIAQVPILTDLFPVFRAHPLLFQFTLAVFYSYDSSDVIGRQASAAIGVATVLLVFLLGNRLYGRRAGLIAALLLAVMPYHVIPTRQVLLDGPMTLYATLTLYLLARFADTERPVWLYAVSIAMGLTFLAKETGILLVGAIYAFLALSPEIRVRIRDAVLSLALMVLTMLPYPLSVSLAGGGSGGKTQQYLVWQLFRRPNHTWDFYLTVAPPAIGIGVIVAAAACLWLLRHRITWREKLLVMWILVPVAFFQLWPTKGFQYLLPIAPPLTLLAARALTYWPQKSLRWRQFRLPQAIPGAVMAAAIAVSLILPTWRQIHPYASDTFLAIATAAETNPACAGVSAPPPAQGNLVSTGAQLTPSMATTLTATTSTSSSAPVNITMIFPSGAVTEATTVTLTVTAPATTTAARIKQSAPALQEGGLTDLQFTVEAVTAGGVTQTRFMQPYTVTVRYADANVSGIDEQRLALRVYNPAVQSWAALVTQPDAANNCLAAAVNRPGAFGVTVVAGALQPPVADPLPCAGMGVQLFLPNILQQGECCLER